MQSFLSNRWGLWLPTACALLIGCSRPTTPQSTASHSPRSATLVYGRGGESDMLDPIHVDSGESVKVIVNLFDTLVTYDARSTELVPCLATDWQCNADGTEWTFHLREDVTFHDGTPLDADAVVFTFERLMLPKHPHVHYSVIPYALEFRSLKSVRSEDARTVVFKLKQPSAVFLANLAMFSASIVSPTAVKERGKRFAIAPVGSGPFQFDHWRRDEELALSAFDKHWRGRPGVDRVIFIPVTESAVRVKQLERGEIHLADNLPPAELNALANHPDIRIQQQPGMNLAYLSMQNDRPPLDNRLVRQAIWHAIDKRGLIQIAYAGQATAAVNPVPQNMWAANDQIIDRPFDPERSKALLAQASQESNVALPIRLELFVMASPRPYLPQPREAAIFIKRALADVGIEVTIVTGEISLHFQRLSRGEHDLGLAGWSSDNADPDNFLYALLDSDNINDLGGNNTSRYRNDDVHRLLREAKSELDRDRREAMYRQAQQQIFHDAPIVPLVHTDVRVAQRRALKGYQLHPSGTVWLREAHFEGTKR